MTERYDTPWGATNLPSRDEVERMSVRELAELVANLDSDLRERTLPEAGQRDSVQYWLGQYAPRLAYKILGAMV